MQKMKSITDSKYEDHIQIYTIADRELSESPTTSRAAPPSSDHVDRDNVDHIPSCSTELRPPDHQTTSQIMIAAKNGATTTATTVRTGRKARRPDDFITADQISIKDK